MIIYLFIYLLPIGFLTLNSVFFLFLYPENSILIPGKNNYMWTKIVYYQQAKMFLIYFNFFKSFLSELKVFYDRQMGMPGRECIQQLEVMECPQAWEEALGQRGQGLCTVNDSNATLTGLVIFEISLQTCPWYLDLLPIPHVRKIIKSSTNVWKAFIQLGPNLIKRFIFIGLFS